MHRSLLSSLSESFLNTLSSPFWGRRLSATVVLGCALGGGSVSTAYAETLFGVYAGAASWQQEVTGDISSGFTDVDIESDLGMDDDRNNMFYIAVEHPIPVLPNVRAQYAAITLSGDNVLAREVQFNGNLFSVSDQIITDIDLTQTDAVFYYEVFDNYVSLDLGVAARWMDGYVALASTTEAARAEFSGVLPMLYGKARVDLPLSGFWVGAEAQGIAYGGDQLIDANAQIGWESRLGLGAELGWRTFALELEEYDEINAAQVDVNGPYFGLNFHF